MSAWDQQLDLEALAQEATSTSTEKPVIVHSNEDETEQNNIQEEQTQDKTEPQQITKQQYKNKIKQLYKGVEELTHNKKVIVLDTGAIIEGRKISEIASKEMDLLSIQFLTTTGVFREVKTSKAKKTLYALPFDLKIVEPTEESVKLVSEYAKLSGDYGALSTVDIGVVALTLDAETARHGTSHLKPKPKAFNLTRRKVELTPYPGTDKPRSYERRGMEELQKEKEALDRKLNTEEESDSDDSDSDSDSDGWITTENVKQKIAEENEFLGAQEQEEHWTIENGESQVGCMTTDFAMQNVMMTMGLTLVSSTGYRIRGVRRYVLRCTSCFMMEPDTSVQFCDNCGNYATLRRVECVMQEDGEPVFYYNPRFKFNLRGTKYHIPTSKGGKKNKDPLLREDQLSRFRNRTGVQYAGKKTRQRAKLMKHSANNSIWTNDYHYESTFGNAVDAQDALRKSEWASKDSYFSGYDRRNPNSWSKRKFKKKKRN